MKRIHSTQNFSILSPQQASPIFFDRELSEEDILTLQDIFLTPGIQHIVVPSVSQGRNLLRTFLAVLPCYHDIAVITASKVELPDHYLNIYDMLVEDGYIDSLTGLSVNPQALDEFFIEHGYFDFMWIEATPELQNKSWFVDFLQKLQEINVNTQIPIAIATYKHKGDYVNKQMSELQV